jgi:rRNA-processing protein FCF1
VQKKQVVVVVDSGVVEVALNKAMHVQSEMRAVPKVNLRHSTPAIVVHEVAANHKPVRTVASIAHNRPRHAYQHLVPKLELAAT